MTEATYYIKLQHIEQLNPENPLLQRLQGGFSAINALYAERIWKKLDLDLLLDGAENTEGVQEVERDGDASTTTEGSIDLATDEIFKAMLAKKYYHRNQLRVTSNKFHSCRTDEQRKAVSIQVNELFEVFRSIQVEIQYYEKHGRLPASLEKEEVDTFFDIPTTEGGVLAKIDSCHATISTIHRELKEYDFKIRNDPNHARYKSLVKLEERLKKWEKKKKLLWAERERYKLERINNTNI
jgi:hypothetical protein